eukprot:1147687-Pelagomonas_calceolata.AAC.8
MLYLHPPFPHSGLVVEVTAGQVLLPSWHDEGCREAVQELSQEPGERLCRQRIPEVDDSPISLDMLFPIFFTMSTMPTILFTDHYFHKINDENRRTSDLSSGLRSPNSSPKPLPGTNAHSHKYVSVSFTHEANIMQVQIRKGGGQNLTFGSGATSL